MSHGKTNGIAGETTLTDTAPGIGPDQSQLVDRRMALAREWDDLVEQVRQLEGFEDFLLPPPIEKLLPAAEHGPVAVINVSRWRCDALLVTADEVRVQELPKLTAEKVERRVAEYLLALQTVRRCATESWLAEEACKSDSSAAALDRRERAQQAHAQVRTRADTLLRVMLLWLWEAIAEPVLNALGFHSTPEEGEWPRMWWCPTGLLTLLPLHAAGDHAVKAAHRPTVIDRVVSSYTPTLRALVESRNPLPESQDPPRMLAVTIADTPGEPPLPAVAIERERLVDRFAGRCTVRDGEDATVAEVRKLLPTHRWVHLSCHGDQILKDPSRGGLRLFDGTLTIAEISADQYQGEFAFLSACMTATGGVDLADEAITLAAAMHYMGYRHVIGTLWTVYEATAAEVAQAMYGSAGEFNPAQSAQRLHHVLRRLRDTKRLSAWTPFTHTGP